MTTRVLYHPWTARTSACRAAMMLMLMMMMMMMMMMRADGGRGGRLRRSKVPEGLAEFLGRERGAEEEEEEEEGGGSEGAELTCRLALAELCGYEETSELVKEGVVKWVVEELAAQLIEGREEARGGGGSVSHMPVPETHQNDTETRIASPSYLASSKCNAEFGLAPLSILKLRDFTVREGGDRGISTAAPNSALHEKSRLNRSVTLQTQGRVCLVCPASTQPRRTARN
eukprot:1610882-Rhodomonas_salina.1